MGEERPKPEALVRLIRSMPSDVQHLIFYDTDHTSPEIRQVLSHPDVVLALRETGRNIFFQEGPVQANSTLEAIGGFFERVPSAMRQPLVGLAEWGTAAAAHFQSPYHTENATRRDELNRAFTAQTLRPLAQGMQVMMPDPGYGAIDPRMEAAVRDLHGSISEAKCNAVAEHAFRQSNPASAEIEADMERMIRERTRPELDETIAWNIQHLAKGQRSSVLYGMGHGIKGNDLDEHLPGSVTVALYPNERSRFTSSLASDIWLEIGQTATDLPDYMYVISSDQLTKLEEHTPSADRFRARFPNAVTGTAPVLTEEEHKACVATLPERLRRNGVAYQPVSTEQLGGLPVVAVPALRGESGPEQGTNQR